MRRPALEFEEIFFPEKVLCQLSDCPSYRDPLGRRSQATVQEKYTKVCVCYRCHVRIMASYRVGTDGEIFIGKPSKTGVPVRKLGLEGCRLLGSERCPCGREADCPLYHAPEKLETT